MEDCWLKNRREWLWESCQKFHGVLMEIVLQLIKFGMELYLRIPGIILYTIGEWGGATVVPNGQVWYANSSGSYYDRPMPDRPVAGNGFIRENLILPNGKKLCDGWCSSTKRMEMQIPIKCDFIVFMAGTNDLGQDAKPSDFMKSVRNVVEWILINRSKSRIYVSTLIPRRKELTNNSELYKNKIQLTSKDYAEMTKEICGMMHVNCIDLHSECCYFMNEWDTYLRDIVHPNERGSYEIGKMIGDAIISFERKEGII